MTRHPLLGLIPLILLLDSSSLCSLAMSQEPAKPISIRIGIVNLSTVKQSFPLLSEVDRDIDELELQDWRDRLGLLWSSLSQEKKDKCNRITAMISLVAIQRVILINQIMGHANSLASDLGGVDMLVEKTAILYGAETADSIDLTDRLLESLNNGELERLPGWKNCKSVNEECRQFLKEQRETRAPDEPKLSL